MYKKIISSILILSLLIQFGCYSVRELTLEEVRTNIEINELTIIKRDSLSIIFEKPEFVVLNDTIKGKGRIIGKHAQLSDLYDYNISLSDIVTFETSEFDPAKTLIYTGITIVIIVGLFFLVLAAEGGISGPTLKL